MSFDKPYLAEPSFRLAIIWDVHKLRMIIP